MLKERKFNNVTVLERRSDCSFETNKSYLYLLAGRGLKILLDVLSISESEFATLGIQSSKFTSIKEVLVNGAVKTKSIPVDSQSEIKYWLPRKSLMDILTKHCNNKGINISYKSTVHSIEYSTDNNSIDIIYDTDDMQTSASINAKFVIACDGYNSSVRNWLQKTSVNEQFKTIEMFSDSSKLMYKILQINSNFTLPNKEKSVNEEAYVIRSNDSSINLGLLPVRDTAIRTANIICKSDHEIWKIKNKYELKIFFQLYFPQIDSNEIATDDSYEHFASSTVGIFPFPSYSSELYKYFLTCNDGNCICDATVLLIGDAAHFFPPDLGQGINSALEDVYELYHSLLRKQNNVMKAVACYAKKRIVQHKALIKLHTFAFPYQYNQDIMKKRLWYTNFALRLTLNKVFPFFFSKPAFFLVQNSNHSYQKILQNAHNTTRNICIILLAMAIGMLRVLKVI